MNIKDPTTTSQDHNDQQLVYHQSLAETESAWDEDKKILKEEEDLGGEVPNCTVVKKLSGEEKIEIMVSSPDNVAIAFDGAYKHYGSGRRKVPVLIGLDMTIPKGAIYGLLGPSGCGKTTLLSCIVGKQRLKAGTINVFGGRPGSEISGELNGLL